MWRTALATNRNPKVANNAQKNKRTHKFKGMLKLIQKIKGKTTRKFIMARFVENSVACSLNKAFFSTIVANAAITAAAQANINQSIS